MNGSCRMEPAPQIDRVKTGFETRIEMKQRINGYELKDMAKDILRGNYGTIILGQFLFWLIIFGVVLVFSFPYMLSFIAAFYSSAGYPGSSTLNLYRVGTVISQVLYGFLDLGSCYLCLKIICRQRNGYQDIFFGFHRGNVLKTLGLTAVRLILNYLCLGAGQYLMSNYLITQDYHLLLYALIAYTLGYCIYIPVALALDNTYFLLLDFPEKKIGGILKSSFRLIRGNRKRLFLLELSFIPLQLLAFLSFGVGSLWLSPYMHMTYTLFYIDLANPGCLQNR